MEWQFDNERPIYSQLVDILKLKIVSGEYKPGERLPSVRDISSEAGVNPNTMQRAMQELENQNLVLTQRTAGRFVTEDKERVEMTREELAEGHIQSFVKLMEQLGYSKSRLIALLAAKIGEVKE
ncbi:MAG: GntR family transcriptional regulator [Ruminococcaceae bacterium]|nr:GntR family transcriptional regulator [Oscillospiraceae bacterium]